MVNLCQLLVILAVGRDGDDDLLREEHARTANLHEVRTDGVHRGLFFHVNDHIHPLVADESHPASVAVVPSAPQTVGQCFRSVGRVVLPRRCEELYLLAHRQMVNRLQRFLTIAYFLAVIEGMISLGLHLGQDIRQHALTERLP